MKGLISAEIAITMTKGFELHHEDGQELPYFLFFFKPKLRLHHEDGQELTYFLFTLTSNSRNYK